jgi:hypothetical protein
MFFVIHILPFIRLAVLPLYVALTMHLVLVPLTYIDPVVRPCVGTVAMDVVLGKLTQILGTISEVESTFAMFLGIYVFPLILCVVWPYLHPLTMLLVIHPLTLIFGTVDVGVDTYKCVSWVEDIYAYVIIYM